MTAADLARAAELLKRFSTATMDDLRDPVQMGKLQGKAYALSLTLESELTRYRINVSDINA